MHVWMPSDGWATESSDRGQPPQADVHDKEAGTSGAGNKGGRVSSPILNGIIPLRRASCAEQSGVAAANKFTSLADGVQGHPQWSCRTFSVIGFSLSLIPMQPHAHHPLFLSLWSNNITKGSFLKYGQVEGVVYAHTIMSIHFLSCQNFSCS